VAVLESAGLVTREVRGRDHWLSLQLAALSPAETWIHEQAQFWSDRADALESRLRRRQARNTR